MNDWFTVEEIDGSTYAISEYDHWEQTHCYLLLGAERALLIDTGLGVGDLRAVVDSLTKLPVLAATTHVHWDHIGGHRAFQNIAVQEAEQEWLSGRFPLPHSAVIRNLTMQPCNFPENFFLEAYRIFRGNPKRILHDGDTIELGNRKIKVIHTPGHSPGHCCFYESDRKYLYSGDLIYMGCLDAFYPSTDPQAFWQSIQKVRSLQTERILPGHYSLAVPADIIERIENAFSQLSDAGKLSQGSGVFSFGDFQIHL